MRNSLGLGGPQRDLLCNGTSGFLFWCLPWFAFALGWAVSPIWRTLLWTASLGVMGILCLLNASRCGRVHCYFTGPFFLLGAVASLGYGFGLLPLGASGWKWICAITVVGVSPSLAFQNSFSVAIDEIDLKGPNPPMKPTVQLGCTSACLPRHPARGLSLSR